MSSILEKIKQTKLEEVQQLKKNQPTSLFDASENVAIRSFTASLKAHKPAIIAEIKKASPSKGILRDDFNVEAIAKAYEENGASCLSVLTDKPFFQGDAHNIQLARKQTSLPILRKDFIVDAYQVTESRFLQADCILLIAAILDDHKMMDFCQQAQTLGLEVLVETHTEHEVERALRLPTSLIGINNRDLHKFETNLDTSIRLNKFIPDSKITISESGIHCKEDIERLMSHNIHSFLIGEQFMKAEDVGQALRCLIN